MCDQLLLQAGKKPAARPSSDDDEDDEDEDGDQDEDEDEDGACMGRRHKGVVRSLSGRQGCQGFVPFKPDISWGYCACWYWYWG